jgi:hypothetical protein
MVYACPRCTDGRKGGAQASHVLSRYGRYHPGMQSTLILMHVSKAINEGSLKIRT